MVTLEFGSTQKVTVPDGTYPAPAPRLEVRHPSAITRDDKGLVPLTLETGEVMWIHPDLVQDVQRRSKEPNSKGKSCNVISVLSDVAILHQLPSVIQKEKSMLAQHRQMRLNRRAPDPENHT